MPALKIVKSVLFPITLLITTAIFILFPKISRAAPGDPANLGIANGYTLSDPQAVDGDIICFTDPNGELKRCQTAYDQRMLGVLTATPQISLTTGPNEVPVVKDGQAEVNVTDAGGPIKTGDYVTSSNNPGKGQKADQSGGYVLGAALENLNGKEGRIRVALGIGPSVIPYHANILDELGVLLLKNVSQPQGAALFIRYLTAGLLVMTVTFLAFMNFGRNITKGVEAIGRNPLAKNQIQFMVIINIVLITVVTLGGVVLGLAIIRL